MRRLLSWLVVATLTVSLTAVTTVQALERYRSLQSGWSWDLAYYNQWFWALTRGDQVVTVRPASSYADEGPSVWKMNYLAPIRFALVPIYQLWPGPETLLIIQNVIFWWVIPAAFTLTRAESKSDGVALAATVLVPLTPLVWPLVWNDFRELQLAMPFVLWAIQGCRGRNLGLAVIGIGGMLACRQEFALVAASLAIVPPREREDIGRTYLWAQTVMVAGLAWLFFGFFGYLRWCVASTAPEQYIQQFLGPKAALKDTLATAFDFLAVGVGSWAILACLAPRAAVLALPWVWSLSSGRWALRYLGTEQWHHVRYTVPFVALIVAAGLIGFARLAAWLRPKPAGHWALVAAWVLVVMGLVVPLEEVMARMTYIPRPIDPEETARVWKWIRQVGPNQSVLAAYEVAAPLSSRRRLYSYVLNQNQPKGYPRLDSEFRWIFFRKGAAPLETFTSQGFTLVHDGPFLWIFRRGEPSGEPNPRKISDSREPSG
jgi:uncharacterized membrane protein